MQNSRYRTMKTLIFLTILLFLTGVQKVAAQNPDALAQQAAKAFTAHQFEASIVLYNKIVAQGYESAALYYNLGNAYFRNNQLPEAVLYYEKALKLSPNDEDIRHNIGVVNSKLTDKVEQVPELFYKRWWKSLSNSMNINTLGIVNLVLLTISLLLIIVYIVSNMVIIKKLSFWSACVLFLLFITGSLAASHRQHYLKNQHEAIVFSPTVNIKSSPDANSKDIFVLHEGTKVKLLDEVANWQEIRIANGSTGWILNNELRKI